jgi:protein SCO1
MDTTRRLPRLWVLGAGLVLALGLIGTGIGIAVTEPGSATPVEANPVQPTQRVVPPAVSHIPLENQNGQTTDLAALHGRVVVLADFMTSCQEECPITTGALLQVHESLAAAHLSSKVAIVEVTVDPWRDNPSRLLAYQHTFGVHWTMLTGSAANLHRLWSWFGVFYQRVPEGNPPAINWQTGRPYTFDVNHTDNAFVLDEHGNERALTAADANVGGRLSHRLSALLDAQGQQDLHDPGSGSWTPSDMLEAVGSVLGRSIPTAQ